MLRNFSIRGKLGSFSHLSRNIGVLMAYVVGALVQYKLVPCIFVAIPIIFGIWFFFLPNTPQYHLKKGDINVRNFHMKMIYISFLKLSFEILILKRSHF